tara:strand:- start:1748 stop:1972 length:225 start_codon:yes stop_codon:yes gene_type:complete
LGRSKTEEVNLGGFLAHGLHPSSAKLLEHWGIVGFDMPASQPSFIELSQPVIFVFMDSPGAMGADVLVPNPVAK